MQCGCTAESRKSEISHIHHEKLQTDASSVGLNCLNQTKKKEEEAAAVSRAASVDAAVAAVFIRIGRRFYIKRTKNCTDGFSRWERCFHFTPDRLWQEFSYGA